MHNAINAYNQNAKATLDPRELEASLLLKAAAKLQIIKESWEEEKKNLLPALTYNRRLWTIFSSAMSEAENPLPQAIKNNIASLGVFIMKHTLDVQINPSAEKLTVLININREIAAGLHGKISDDVKKK